ncbi:hypothetical protein M3Y99_00998500 [Aphelenchoides fujianensis]|nr:hypothetical protein M3Y99_00998500 [Aphelenchoides fujianensis]
MKLSSVAVILVLGFLIAPPVFGSNSSKVARPGRCGFCSWLHRTFGIGNPNCCVSHEPLHEEEVFWMLALGKEEGEYEELKQLAARMFPVRVSLNGKMREFERADFSVRSVFEFAEHVFRKTLRSLCYEIPSGTVEVPKAATDTKTLGALAYAFDSKLEFFECGQ